MTKHPTDLRFYFHPSECAYIRTTTVSYWKSPRDVAYGGKGKSEYLTVNFAPITRSPRKLQHTPMRDAVRSQAVLSNYVGPFEMVPGFLEILLVRSLCCASVFFCEKCIPAGSGIAIHGTAPGVPGRTPPHYPTGLARP